MIVRILGEGQFLVADSAVVELNALDETLESALTDETRFAVARDALLARVRDVGEPLDPDALEASDIVLPGADSQASEVAAMLTEEGLIPD